MKGPVDKETPRPAVMIIRTYVRRVKAVTTEIRHRSSFKQSKNQLTSRSQGSLSSRRMDLSPTSMPSAQARPSSVAHVTVDARVVLSRDTSRATV